MRYAARGLSLLLVALGLATSGYLLYRSLALLAASAPEAPDICSEMFGTGCDETLLSSGYAGIAALTFQLCPICYN